ncbi:hypothetical protein [Corynebacterium sp. MC3]|uniref:hypothetical protein n=1 Tax=Corynebacterium sp. MC3 TaxID=1720193 RepID=UPI0008D9C78A|nr:hypothetical protein [Corynebacterium sp. MC3]
MLIGNMNVEVWRSQGRNRDGDQEFVFHHRIENCIFQERDLSGWLGSDKSDRGQTRYAVDADAELYVNPGEDIQEGDHVKYQGQTWQVDSHLVTGTYPSGWQPGAKVFLSLVRGW